MSCGTTLHLQRVLSLDPDHICADISINGDNKNMVYRPTTLEMTSMPLLMWADARMVQYTMPRGIRNQPYFENFVCNALPNPVTNTTHNTINTSIT